MAKIIYSTPTSDDFYAIPEFLTHQQCWMVWPERTDNWRLGAKPAQAKIVEIANIISKKEHVNMLVSKQQFTNARKQLNENITIIEMSTNDCFIRDYGPLFLQHQTTNEIRGLKFNFNSWGGEKAGIYYPWNDDNMVAYKIFELQNIDYYYLPIVLEPSMLILDSDGTCFASYEGIICYERNPNLTVEQAEHYLKNYLNVTNIIWIPYGLPFDETKGRLDNIMCLVDNKTILVSWTNNTSDERYHAVESAYDILFKATNCHGKRYIVIKVPLPPMDIRTTADINMIDYNINHNDINPNQKLVTSYLNLYISNNLVLIPSFNDKTSQEKMLDIMGLVFTNHQIILIDIREIILGKSGIHSLICHQPAIIKRTNDDIVQYVDDTNNLINN